MSFTHHDEAELLKRYSDRLGKFGETDEALGWTKPKQKLRYHILLDYWLKKSLPHPLRVLDFGCGFGGLYGYAQEIGARIEYCGIDINDDLISVAKRRYPAARFLTLNVFQDRLDEIFDVVLSSGVHNHRLTDNEKFNEMTFSFFDQCSTVGFASNFLSSRVNFRNESNFYSEPADALNRALSYSNRSILRHDYMPFEFTVFVDKCSKFDEELTVFPDFLNLCR